MLGSSDPLDDALEHVLERVEEMLHRLIVNLSEDGYLGR